MIENRQARQLAQSIYFLDPFQLEGLAPEGQDWSRPLSLRTTARMLYDRDSRADFNRDVSACIAELELGDALDLR